MIIAIFEWIELKFATQVTLTETSYEPKLHIVLMKTNWEINKTAQKNTIHS